MDVGARPVGRRALLVEVADPAACYADLVRRRGAGELAAVEIVPGAGTVLLDGVEDREAVAARLSEWSPGWSARGGPGAAEGRLVEITVRYRGGDLPDVADLWGTSVEAVVDRLSAVEYRVAFCGFAPGFAYLTGLPAELAVPRLDTPRTRVPAGSVGLAGGYAAIYPTASPGGWRLVGETDIALFDVDADPPALLTPGTRVRLPAR
ncbi:MAG TPA: allophanate hydrolase subunit 1 [Micromonosporaceae bacterium]|nr:allophanate hydrolase subunit 1 [Micromonosporaceae bacterium]